VSRNIDAAISVHFLCGFHIEIGNAYLPRSPRVEHPPCLTDDRKVLNFTLVTVVKDHDAVDAGCVGRADVSCVRGLRVVRFTSVLCALSCLVLFLVLSRGTRRVGAPPFERCARSAPGALVPVRVILPRSIITYSAPSAPLAGITRFRR
jgi:hypothetical protein